MSVRRLVLCAALLLLGAAPLHARQLAITDARVESLVEELERRSPTARRMLEAMRSGRVPVAIGTHAQMAADMTRLSREWDPRARRAVGLMAAVFAPDSERTRVGEILISLDIDRVEEIFREVREEPTKVPWDVIRREELLAVLGHELAHAYGLVLHDGDVRVHCDDPADGVDPTTSCVVLAENTIRSELRIPLDWGYGMPAPVELAARYAALAERQAALREIGRRTVESMRSFAPALP